MTNNLMEYFNRQPRLGTLSTADQNGKVDSAYFGSPRMIDEKTIFMGLGNNRTFACTCNVWWQWICCCSSHMVAWTPL